MTEPWMDEAVCAQTAPELFFPEGGTHGQDAKRLCGVSPVKAVCLEYALTHDIEHGVWGGLDARARAALKREAA